MKTLSTTAAAFLLFLSLSLSAMAQTNSNWEHVRLKSRQAAEITLDYKTIRYGYYGSVLVDVTDLWIHVNRDGLGPQDKVSVVLMNHPFYQPNNIETCSFVLKYADANHFMLNVLNPSMNVFNAHQQLAVVINGEWQKVDFQSDNSNFDFSFVPYIPR